jgi:RNA polymerase sigma factor (sigma-70 family)
MDESESERKLTQLARRAIDGEPNAIDQLLAELGPQLVRTVRLVVGAGSWSAEDAAQEAMIDITRGISRLRDPRAVRGWALRVAVARGIKVARRERLRSLGRPLTQAPELASEEHEEHADELKRAFDRLAPRMRAVAVLRLYAGLSEQETAEALGCSRGTVKSQLHEAREQLAKALRAEGAAPLTMPPHLPTQADSE